SAATSARRARDEMRSNGSMAAPPPFGGRLASLALAVVYASPVLRMRRRTSRLKSPSRGIGCHLLEPPAPLPSSDRAVEQAHQRPGSLPPFASHWARLGLGHRGWAWTSA